MTKLLFWIMLDYTLILQQVNLLKIYFFFFSFKPLSRVLNYISLSPSANRTSSGIIMWLISLSLIINSHDIISENKCPRSISRQDHSTWIPAFCCDIREIYFAARSQTFCQLCPEKQPLGPLRFPVQLSPLAMESRTLMQFVWLYIESTMMKWWCWG